MLIPKIEEVDRLDLTQVCWVLVIEKEVCMRTILSSGAD